MKYIYNNSKYATVLFCLGVGMTVTAYDSLSAYQIVDRPSTRTLSSWSYEDEANISFDGDVAAIQELALQKAAILAASDNDGNSSPRDDGSEETPISCATKLAQSVLTVRFEYAVEYDPFYTSNGIGAGRNLQERAPMAIIDGIEKELQMRLSKSILVCESNDREVLDANIVGLVRSKEGGVLEDTTCDPEDGRNSCAAHFGKVTIFIAEKEDEDTNSRERVQSLVLTNIRREIEDPSMVVSIGQGLVKITFLGDVPVVPVSNDSTQDSDSSMSGISIVVMTVGAAVVLVFLTGVFAWRRNSKQDVELLHDEAESSIRGFPSTSEDEDSFIPPSPFTDMMPSAYRYGENSSILSDQMGLSAVTEVTENSSPQTKSPSSQSPNFAQQNNSPKSLLVVDTGSAPESQYSSGPSFRPDQEGDGGYEDEISEVSISPTAESNQTSTTIGSLLGIASPARKTNTPSYPTSDDDDDLLFLA